MNDLNRLTFGFKKILNVYQIFLKTHDVHMALTCGYLQNINTRVRFVSFRFQQHIRKSSFV